jgi:hypothetical protein
LLPGVKSPTIVGTNLPSNGRQGTYSPKGTSRILSYLLSGAAELESACLGLIICTLLKY